MSTTPLVRVKPLQERTLSDRVREKYHTHDSPLRILLRSETDVHTIETKSRIATVHEAFNRKEALCNSKLK